MPPDKTILVYDASPSSFSTINTAWAAHLQQRPGTSYAILGRPTGGLSWTQQLEEKTGRGSGSVVLCLGGNPDWGLVEATVELGVHLICHTRDPVFLKSLLYQFDFAAFKTGSLVLPACDLLTLCIDITTLLLEPTSTTTSLTTTFRSPLVGLKDSAVEAELACSNWNHAGVPLPTNDDGPRMQVVWDREDRALKPGKSSLTEPYHCIVNRIWQRKAGVSYSYVEEVATGGILFTTLSALCMAWAAFWSLFSTPILRLHDRQIATLPLDLTLTKSEGGGRENSAQLVVPAAPSPSNQSVAEMVALTELALVVLAGDLTSKEGGVMSTAAALGQDGGIELRKQLERAGWSWKQSA